MLVFQVVLKVSSLRMRHIQRHEILVDYLHKDEVLRLMQQIGSVVSELVQEYDGRLVVEEEMRVELVKRTRVLIEPLMQEEVFTPEGEPE